MNKLDEASAELLNRFLMMQELLFRGENLDEELKESLNVERQALHEKVEDFRARLFQMQQKEREWNQEVLADIGEVGIFEAAKFQRKNIKNTLAALKPVAKNMENSLSSATEELAQKRALNNELKEDLSRLNNRIKNHTYSFQGAMGDLGQRLPSYISNSMQGTNDPSYSSK